MSDTPNVLKEKNVHSRFLTANSSSSKIKGCHLASHHNSNNHTPVNSKTKLNFGSSKIDSSKKKIANFSKIATLNSKSTATPPTSRSQINTNIRSGSSTKNSFGINPICKGIDYTSVMQKKAQFGYAGPGYIVEFDCDSKHLRGLWVEKGLWKVTSRASNETKEAILGIEMMYTRIDEPNRCTPLKQLTNYDFTYNPRSEFSGSIRKNLFSSDDMNLESKTAKPKKCLKWADNLERIEEKSQNIFPNIEEQQEEKNGSPKVVKKLRKSMSMTDIKQIIADLEGDNETLEEVDSNKIIDLKPNQENLNATYDKVEPKINTPISQVVHNVFHLSPAKVTNSSFLDQAVSTNMLHPKLNFPSISPVRDLSVTQTLSTNPTDSLIKETKSNNNEKKDLEKDLDEFVNKFKEVFGEKGAEQDEDDQIFLKQDYKNSINSQNRYNITLKFDQMAEMIRQFKIDMYKEACN